MDLKLKDFPIYQKMLKEKTYGISKLQFAFKLATKGADEAKWFFAIQMYQLAEADLPGLLPSFSEDERKKTLESTLGLVEKLANKRHPDAMILASVFHIKGIGCAPNHEASRRWISDLWALHAEGKLPAHSKIGMEEVTEMFDEARAKLLRAQREQSNAPKILP